MRNFWLVSLLFVIATTLTGCAAPLFATAAGVGGSAALTHTNNGITYRTFTAPTMKMRTATLSALSRMKIDVVAEGMVDKSNIRFVTAKTTDRNINIQLEPISVNTTRMRVTAKSSLFSYDSATAEEIIQQTKKSLG